MSHLLLMTVYATLVSAFFALLWRQEPKDRLKLFLQLFVGMMAGGLVLGWLMYLAPSGPAIGPVP